jgi:uncharacterized surface protein with fasciclin (FAS1) repeats
MLRSKLIIVVTMLAVIALAFTAVVPAKAAPPKFVSIVDVAIAVNSEGPFAGSFDTLIAALLAADPAVLNTLSGRGQFTVFAPTDAAFAKLGLDETNIGSLDQAALTNILLYHVARGNRDAASVLSSDRIRMLNGGFTFVDSQAATIDGKNSDPSKILVTDVFASNGVIHVIDTVLLP